MHKPTMPVTPQGGYIDYQDDRLGRPHDTLDTDEMPPPLSLEEEFHMSGGEEDGVCGKLKIDTLFENMVEPCIDMPRSQMQERPYRAGELDDGVNHNPRFGAITPPNHEGVNNPAPVDLKKGQYPHRRY